MLYSQLKSESLTALKAGDSRLVNALKFIISELGYAIDMRNGEPADEEVIRVLTKEAKKRKDAIEIYEKAGDAERTDQEKYELNLIEKYLPTLMSEAEVEAVVAQTATETGLTGGRLMGAVMGKLRGKADGGVINKIVMAKFS